MLGEDRVKLLLKPAFGPLQRVLDTLRGLPWPGPVQRLTLRGLARLKARIPELAELLDGKLDRKSVARPASAVVANSAPATAAPATVGEPALASLVTQLSAGDFETRAKAARALSRFDDDEAVDALSYALRDRSVEVAVAAAGALAVSRARGARQTLFLVLANADGYYHPLTRAAAVYGLGGALTDQERAPLEHALRDHDAEVSIAAIAALSASYAQASTAALFAVVENRDGFFLPVTRLAAARGLARLPPAPHEDLARIRGWEGDAAIADALDGLLASAPNSLLGEA